jgi:hypothetical protein
MSCARSFTTGCRWSSAERHGRHGSGRSLPMLLPLEGVSRAARSLHDSPLEEDGFEPLVPAK